MISSLSFAQQNASLGLNAEFLDSLPEDVRLDLMKELEKDQLLKIYNNELTVFEQGKIFIRNICMCLDAKMLRNKPTTSIFSQTI